MAENSTEEHTGPTANTKPAAKFIIPKAMVIIIYIYLLCSILCVIIDYQ